MSYVWVQLFYKGKDEPGGQPIPIEASEIKYGGIIAGLNEAVKDKMAEELTHCSAANLVVYSPETTPPFSQDKAIDPGDHVPAGTTSKNPLIVVAPAPKQQQQQRLVSCRAWSSEGNHLSYNLQANSYHNLKQQASQKFYSMQRRLLFITFLTVMMSPLAKIFRGTVTWKSSCKFLIRQKYWLGNEVLMVPQQNSLVRLLHLILDPMSPPYPPPLGGISKRFSKPQC
jgi:hypothetical protein